MQMTQADSPSPSLPSPLTKLQEKRGCDAAHAQQSARRQMWCGAGVLRLAAGAVVHQDHAGPTAQGIPAWCKPVMPFIKPQPNRPQSLFYRPLCKPGGCLGRGCQPYMTPPALQPKPYQLSFLLCSRCLSLPMALHLCSQQERFLLFLLPPLQYSGRNITKYFFPACSKS